MKCVLLIILALGLITESTHAAFVDYFLKLEGVDGESADARHPGEIEIMSFSWGVSQAGGFASSGGGGTGKVSFQDMTFTAKVSKASPKLFLYCANGQHVNSVRFVVHRSGGSTQDYLKIELKDVYVTSYQMGGSAGNSTTGEPVPTDQFSVNFAKIVYTYTAFDGSETSGEAVRPTITQ